MTVPVVRNQFGGVGCPAPPAHKDVLTVSTLLHLHKKIKKQPVRECFTVTCPVTSLGKQVIGRLKDVPVLKTQTRN